MQEHNIKVTKTARYFTIGRPGPKIQRLWLVCHGYGQSVSNFLSKFSELDDGKTLIVAPEGLSRFYFGGFTGEVGASWMTKVDRVNEIDDYCLFIQEVYQTVLNDLPNLKETNLLGFSQGGPTILRWATKFKPIAQSIILWAADLAHDIDYDKHKNWLNEKKMFLAIGNKDEFITPEHIGNYQKFINAQQLSIELIHFSGKHKIDRKVLSDLAAEIRL